MDNEILNSIFCHPNVSKGTVEVWTNGRVDMTIQIESPETMKLCYDLIQKRDYKTAILHRKHSDHFVQKLCDWLLTGRLA